MQDSIESGIDVNCMVKGCSNSYWREKWLGQPHWVRGAADYQCLGCDYGLEGCGVGVDVLH